MADLKNIFKDNYLRYASYVILDRAIPSAIDGLKPVQRRLLWILKQIDDSKMHKVANIAGQTMALHPHGDKPIIDALVNLANKGYLLDKQGNFGNTYTGDPASAARYIEARLSQMAKDTLFNAELTEFLPSYDGRAQEPVFLPVKIPLLLMQGAEGIAVGMATKILSHNFTELIEAEIALLQNQPFTILPDFLSGGVMDSTDYDKGRGKVRLRAKIDLVDEKTLVIKEICHGTTTESLINSIDDAAKRGKIKIDAINDYTAEKIEIEIKLPRGHYAHELLDQLYAFTECEITINSQIVVIKEEMPCETTVDDLISHHAELLQGYLQKELEIEQGHLLEKIFQKTLEQIFIENRLYKMIEEVSKYEKIHETIHTSLLPFSKLLARLPTEADQEKLLAIPIRRISRFDIAKNEQELREIQGRLLEIEKELKNIKKFTIKYLQGLLKKYGPLFPRKTKIETLDLIDKRSIATRNIKVGYDEEKGFIGTKVADHYQLECTNMDKLLIMFNNGTFKVINIPEKLYLHAHDIKPVYIGVADKKSIINVCYIDKSTLFPYIKRFIVKQFILDKEYNFLEKDHQLEYVSDKEKIELNLTFKKKAKQKNGALRVALDSIAVKSVQAKGIRMANKELKEVEVEKK